VVHVCGHVAFNQLFNLILNPAPPTYLPQPCLQRARTNPCSLRHLNLDRPLPPSPTKPCLNQVRDKPCSVADIRIEEVTRGGSEDRPSPLRLKREILDRELDRVYEAKTLKGRV